MSRKKILVATDLSERSELSVDKAIELAKKYDLWLEVLHVVDPPVFEWTWGGEYVEEQQKREEKRVEKERQISDKITERLQRRHDKMNVTVRVGSPVEMIIAFAKEQDVSEIVIGGTGEHHPLKNFFFGSTAKNIMEKSHVPVLVVRNDKSVDYQNILIPVDFSDESLWTVKHTAELFPSANLYILHIMEIPSESRMRYYGLEEGEISTISDTQRKKSKEEMETFVKKISVSNAVHPVFAEGSLNTEVLLQQGDRISADLISLTPHKTTGVTSRMIRSIAEELLSDTAQDVMIYQGG